MLLCQNGNPLHFNVIQERPKGFLRLTTYDLRLEPTARKIPIYRYISAIRFAFSFTISRSAAGLTTSI